MVNLIKDWSNVFGLNVAKFKNLPVDADFDLKLIGEEYEETCEALENGDLKEYQDGLGDTLWTTIRAMLNAGIDPEETIKAIYVSNMSKIDATIEDALLTKEKYQSQGKGVNTYMRETKNGFITYRASDGKVLKSHKFIEPNFGK
jgi:NTP pyrophosphatase (non-canonical NTP hydrolase)